MRVTNTSMEEKTSPSGRKVHFLKKSRILNMNDNVMKTILQIILLIFNVIWWEYNTFKVENNGFKFNSIREHFLSNPMKIKAASIMLCGSNFVLKGISATDRGSNNKM